MTKKPINASRKKRNKIIANGKLRQTYDYHNKPRGNRFPNSQPLTYFLNKIATGRSANALQHKTKHFRLSLN